MIKNAFVELAQIQKETFTGYCCGLDPHPLPGRWDGNYEVYNQALSREEDKRLTNEVYPLYLTITNIVAPQQAHNLALMVASVECYLVKVIDIMVKKCNIRVFKPQAGFYEQFGPVGVIMLQRIRQHMKDLEKDYGRIICILDCKRGDIATTQAAYFLGLMGNLFESWGIDYTPFDFDIINVTPWMGSDVMVMGTMEKPGIGLKLMQAGKGIIVVNATSNPSGPRYQKQIVGSADDDPLSGIPLHLMNVQDLALISKEYDLESSGLSTIGLVVGSTHISDGSIRAAFPKTTLLVPGYGAQGGKFQNVIHERISEGPYAGQGEISSLSRASCYPHLPENGGSGEVINLETDLIQATTRFRIAEKAAFDEPGLKEKGIIYPFS
jgi:orotidine 5'-phosphate decarboxylase subfamily 2